MVLGAKGRSSRLWLIAGLAAACASGDGRIEVDLLAELVGAEAIQELGAVDLGRYSPAAAAYVGSGWSYRGLWRDEERSFVWSDAAAAELAFWSFERRPVRLTMTALRHPEAAPEASVVVELNGQTVGEIDLAKHWSEREIVLPEEVVAVGHNRLTLRYGGELHGERHLAFAVDRVAFEPIEASVARADARAAASARSIAPGSALRWSVRVGARPRLVLDVAPAAGPCRPRPWVAELVDGHLHPLDAGEPTNPDEAGTRIELEIDAAARDVVDLVIANRARCDAGGELVLEAARLGHAPTSQPAARPNVVLLLLDALRADRVGAVGYERPTTPVLDALAAQGFVFRQAFAQAPYTAASLPSILTGEYPLALGVNDDRKLSDEVVTMTERLRDGGWQTAAFAANPFFSADFGSEQGFQEFHDLTVGVPLHERGLFSVVLAESFVPRVGDWLRDRSEPPFFLFLHLMQPHGPYAPPPPYHALFGRAEVSPLFGTGERQKRLRRAAAEDVTADDLRDLSDLYDGNLRYVDAQVGRLFSKLRLLGLWDQSLVIVASDHGEEFGEHGHLEHAGYLYDELLHVPILIKLPGADGASGVVDALVENIDISATVFDLIEIEAPPGPARSLLPLMRGEVDHHRDAVFAWSSPAYVDDPRVRGGLAAVRTETHKYIRALAGEDELYDLGTDPDEARDRAGESEVADSQRALADLVDSWLAGQLGAESAAPDLDDERLEQLRSLGYLD